MSPGGFPGSNRTASPKSASTAVKSFFSKTFLLLKSLWTSQEASLGRVYYGLHLNHIAPLHVSSAVPSKSAHSFLPQLPDTASAGKFSCSSLPVSLKHNQAALCCPAQSQPSSIVKYPQNKSKGIFVLKEGDVFIRAGSIWHHFFGHQQWTPISGHFLHFSLTTKAREVKQGAFSLYPSKDVCSYLENKDLPGNQQMLVGVFLS